MKCFSHLILLAPAWMAVASNAFSFCPVQRRASLVSSSLCAVSPEHMVYAAPDSDFASAMPPKPEETIEEKLETSATEFIASMTAKLAEGVEPPPELEALREARDSGAEPAVLAARIYELMIEQGMNYDVDPDTGVLSPTEWVIEDHLDAPEVMQEFDYLYSYGMALIQQGILPVDQVKDIVKKRLIDRTGRTPEEFDAWLGY